MSWDTGTSGGGGWGAPTGGDTWGASGAAANGFSADDTFGATESNGVGGEDGFGANGGGDGRVNDGACFNCGEQG